MRTIKYIEYLIISFLMWIGWVPAIYYFTDIKKLYRITDAVSHSRIDHIIQTCKMAYYTVNTCNADATLTYAHQLYIAFAVYFVALFIISKFRKAGWSEFVDESDFASKKADKDANDSRKKRVASLFGPNVPDDVH